MLVITRKLNEGIVLSDEIKVVVLEVGKDRVRLGIEAPKDVKIVREELYTTVKQNVQAAGALPENVMKQLLNKGKE